MEPAHKRRRAEHEDKIRQALRNKKLVVIVGAGITLSATCPSPPRITWTGLIHDGLDYLQHEGFVAENDMELNHYRKVLQQQQGHANVRAVLRACGYLKDELDCNKQFSTWLNSVFGTLHCEVRHPEVLKILRLFHQRGAKLMTTNYDELLEHHCNLQRIRLSITEDVRKYEQGTLDGIFHIHGSYQDPQEVVLDPISYDRVKISNDVQNLLRTFLGHNTVLFVGCGTGLDDPNFNSLLEWASSREENIPNHHYVLAQDGDNLRFNPLITLRYGTNHEDLVAYLDALLEDPADAFPEGTLERRNTAAERIQGDPLQLLPYASQAPFNAAGKDDDPLCLQNTRVDLLHQIRGWASRDDERHIFWLSGWAGTGKSTIARTVAREHYDKRDLAASFFFSRDGGDVRHAGKFFTSIAVQLANNVPPLRDFICAAIMERSDIASQSLRDQWRQLILGPLSKLGSNSSPQSYILVIDAFDECEDEDYIQTILQLLSEARWLKTCRLRIFLTSRPEIPIRYGFYQIPDADHQDFVLHNISPDAVDHDIAIFLEYKLGHIGRERALGSRWPGEEVIKRLVQSASCLFIWAATAHRFIYEGGPFATRRLAMILDESNSVTAPEKRLDNIYITVLSHSIRMNYTDKEKEELFSALRRILGSLVVLSSQLSANALTKLLNITKQQVDQALDDLHAILDIPEDQTRPLRLHHPSFRDFLLSKARCLDSNFWVDEKQAHQILAESCIRLMSTTLKRDVCGLHAPGVLATAVRSNQLEQYLPSEVQYACLYWVQHLQKSGVKLHDGDQVHQFLEIHLLHWLEALSWMRNISEGILAIITLQSIVRNSDCPRLDQFGHDIKRFVLYCRLAVERAPLQIYSSALVFTPTSSIVRNQFYNHIPEWIQRLPGVQRNWSALLQMLEGHLGACNAVSFSPDGKQLASASDDKTVRLWDAATGAPLQTLEGHSGPVNAVAFSPDGKRLASASNDNTVGLWDAAAGTPLRMLGGHSGFVNAVAFSPDGTRLVSASHDNTVRLWNTATSEPLQTLKGHSYWVRAVAFSPDSTQLASASDDRTIRLWDAVTGELLRTLRGHSSSVTAVAFSPDGKQLVSTSLSKTVRMWGAATGELLQMFEGHSDWLYTVAFSPDGKHLASPSRTETIRLWDAATGELVQTLEGHSNWVHDVAFSPDGKQLVSASGDGIVRLWDTTLRVPLQGLNGNPSSVPAAMTLPPDGKQPPSPSLDKTLRVRNEVRVRNEATGAPLQMLEGHSDFVNALVFSPDSKRLASASRDGTIKLWDVATGTPLQTLEGHSRFVRAVVFSPDGKQLASASDDKTVRLWDTATGALLQTLEDHSRFVYAVAFSPDGKQLASASDDTVVRLWDTATGVSLQTLEGHTRFVCTVAFSPDGKQLASGSDDESVRLWDTATGAPLQTLKDHSRTVCAVAFSPDGKQLASASDDTMVRLWDTATGTPLQTLKGHSKFVLAVAFSPDGEQLASASDDKTVRLWDAATGAPLQTLKVGAAVRALAFSADGSCLETDRGLLDLKSLWSDTVSPQSTVSGGIFVKEGWIARGMENLLWVPWDYRPSSAAVRGSIVVLGHESGRVSFLEFAS